MLKLNTRCRVYGGRAGRSSRCGRAAHRWRESSRQPIAAAAACARTRAVAPALAMAAAGLPELDFTQIKTRSIERTLLPLIKQVRSGAYPYSSPQPPAQVTASRHHRWRVAGFEYENVASSSAPLTSRGNFDYNPRSYASDLLL